MTTLTRFRTAGSPARRHRNQHTEWCAADHRCNLGEHRAEPLIVDVPGLGRALLTRVRATDGREHAEIRLTVALAPTEPIARVQLLGLATDLATVMRRATRTGTRPQAAA